MKYFVWNIKIAFCAMDVYTYRIKSIVAFFSLQFVSLLMAMRGSCLFIIKINAAIISTSLCYTDEINWKMLFCFKWF